MGEQMKLRFTKFRVQNFRNIDDSGWIPVERVTALVGRNESGKTALLRALHKFNPATEEPYRPQREFPRDRYTAEFRGAGEDVPVCHVEFELSDDFRGELRELLDVSDIPATATFTRFYDGSLAIEYDTAVPEDAVPPGELVSALGRFAKAARRIPATDAEEEATQELRSTLANWAAEKVTAVGKLEDLRDEAGVMLLREIRQEANRQSSPTAADAIEALLDIVGDLATRAEALPLDERLDAAIQGALPVFIYFENYGILDSAVYLPRLLQDTERNPDSPGVRTINAMFAHVRLTATEIAELGRETSARARQQGQTPTPEMIAQDQQSKDLRAIKLSSASNDITEQFNRWYGQRRHTIRYQADGEYFRIWVSDDKRPGIEIELESRSRGFQWFFSFYLVFLVESREGHKDAILLLDEPGLHLHPTAQQELIAFFERLAEDNPLIYTTHSPFLIDGDHIHRVRPVREDDTGHSEVSVDIWPRDHETIFPLQAAAGYAMVKGLFQHKKNVLVEGMSDYLYLHGLNLHCRALQRTSLSDDIYITPCGGTKHVGYIASLFLGQKVRPVVLLDGDEAGKARYSALLRDLYAGHEGALLLLSGVLTQEQCQAEDIIGEETLLPMLAKVLGKRLSLNQEDRHAGSIVDQIKAAAQRHGVGLPDGWKHELARRLVVEWSTTEPTDLPADVLGRAEALFAALNQRFDHMGP